MLPYLWIGAKSYDAKNLNKIIVKSLSPKAMQKYVGDSGDNLDDITDILALMSIIDSKLSLKREVTALEQQQNKMKSGNQQSKDKAKLTNGESKSKGERKMPCHKHDGEHDYRDCPDNKKSEAPKQKQKGKWEKPEEGLTFHKGERRDNQKDSNGSNRQKEGG